MHLAKIDGIFPDISDGFVLLHSNAKDKPLWILQLHQNVKKGSWRDGSSVALPSSAQFASNVSSQDYLVYYLFLINLNNCSDKTSWS
jgi:hypothetical protein